MNEAYERFKKTKGIVVRESVELAPLTTYKIGGPADLFVEARSSNDIITAVTAARTIGIPFLILGGGSNVLIADAGFRGLVIKNMTTGISMRGMKGAINKGVQGGDVYVEADSGVSFNAFVRYTIEEGLQGLEMHLGLPGSVGGALFMNSKWMKRSASVGDCLYQATIITPQGMVKTVSHEYFHFSYGSSAIQKSGDVIVSAVFALKRADKELLWKIANETIAYRRETQPQGVKTAGCVFKNISLVEAVSAGTPDHMTSAGYLIDKSGCKDMRVGDATVSPVHANFLVNTGKATCADMVQLIEKIRERVKEKFGVTLIEEIERIGAI